MNGGGGERIRQVVLDVPKLLNSISLILFSPIRRKAARKDGGKIKDLGCGKLCSQR